jgi:hypothetical protein
MSKFVSFVLFMIIAIGVISVLSYMTGITFTLGQVIVISAGLSLSNLLGYFEGKFK